MATLRSPMKTHMSPNTKSGTSQASVESQTESQRSKVTGGSPCSSASQKNDNLPGPAPGRTSRITEARACLIKAKLQINNSRNLKNEIKTEVLEALNKLYSLVKEAEEGRIQRGEGKQKELGKADSDKSELIRKIEEQGHLIRLNTEKVENLKIAIEAHSYVIEKASYATVVAKNTVSQPPEQTALHSVVVTSKIETETGEEVLDRVRKAVNAKEGWIRVERVRKARDRKIVMGCRSEEDKNKVMARLEASGEQLLVEEVKNKDPLLILKDVLLINSDEDVKEALRNQNRDMFHGLDDNASRIQIKFRKKARNPHTNHIILSVSPIVWQRATEMGALHIDLQRIRVTDYSPLVQCSRCLGYGHSRRYCKEEADVCSHCGGLHLKPECADWLAGEPPSCRNCVKAKLAKHEHNAFEDTCPVRKRWDALARSSVAYC